MVLALARLYDVRLALEAAGLLPVERGVLSAQSSSDALLLAPHSPSTAVVAELRALARELMDCPLLRGLDALPALSQQFLTATESDSRPTSPRSPGGRRRMLPLTTNGSALADTDDGKVWMQRVENLTAQLQECMNHYSGRIKAMKEDMEAERRQLADRLGQAAQRVQHLCATLLDLLTSLAEGPAPVSSPGASAHNLSAAAACPSQDDAGREARILQLVGVARKLALEPPA